MNGDILAALRRLEARLDGEGWDLGHTVAVLAPGAKGPLTPWQFPVPAGYWNQFEAPGDGLRYLARVPGLAAAFEPLTGRQAVVSASEGWLVDRSAEELSVYQRGDAATAPDRVEIRVVAAVDADMHLYMVTRRRGAITEVWDGELGPDARHTRGDVVEALYEMAGTWLAVGAGA
jgi:hypothetical protein